MGSRTDRMDRQELLTACRTALACLMNLSTEEFARGGDRPAREVLTKAIAKVTGESAVVEVAIHGEDGCTS